MPRPLYYCNINIGHSTVDNLSSTTPTCQQDMVSKSRIAVGKNVGVRGKHGVQANDIPVDDDILTGDEHYDEEDQESDEGRDKAEGGITFTVGIPCPQVYYLTYK